MNIGINLHKETKELYTKSYKTLMKEIKDNINRWRDISCSWVGRLNIMKMTMLPNAIHRFNAIPIITIDIFHRTGTKKSHNSYRNKKTLNSQSSLEKEEWSWRNQPS